LPAELIKKVSFLTIAIYQIGLQLSVRRSGQFAPNRSHFVSMGYWHTAVPNGADTRGWLGRFADAWAPAPKEQLVVNIAVTADRSTEFVRAACAEYRTKMDYGYGEVGADLKRVAALIKAKAPTRIYYLNFGSFDTHVSQSGQHNGLFDRLGIRPAVISDPIHAIANRST